MKKRDILDEVYTEKQRRWACYQMNAPKSEREISKTKATEMCKDVKHSKKKDENVNPKMKKKDLVEYVKSRKNINEQPEPFNIREMSRHDKNLIFRFFENLRESGLINMFGSHPILCWTKDDLERWLYGQSKDVESVESEIEELEYDNEEGENDSEIEHLQEFLGNINYMLETKNEVRDALIRTALKRIENTTRNHDINNVQRVFEKLAAESFKMWTTVMYG